MDTNIESGKKDSAMLSCDLARQFVNIALGGMAFAVALSLTSKISSCLLWSILIVFGTSVAAGLLFLMHLISLISIGKYEVYRPSVRWISAVQILLVVVGVFLLCISIL
jgi:hypothetical protein